jgi:hypothetical protein
LHPLHLHLFLRYLPHLLHLLVLLVLVHHHLLLLLLLVILLLLPLLPLLLVSLLSRVLLRVCLPLTDLMLSLLMNGIIHLLPFLLQHNKPLSTTTRNPFVELPVVGDPFHHLFDHASVQQPC